MAEMGFGERLKGFIASPVETFQKVKEEDMGPLLRYYVVLALIFSILIAIISAAAGAVMSSILPVKIPGMAAFVGGLAAVITFITVLIGLFIGLFIGGAILHIFVYIVGGRKGYTQTVKALGYGMTPTLLLGWIPFLGIIIAIWSLILEILGVRELHEISTGKAVLAVLLPAIIGIIILGISLMLNLPKMPSMSI